MKRRAAEAAKTLTRDHLRRIAAVAHARDLGFVSLVGLAELDPATAFRGAVIRGADLRGQDFSGFDLTGGRLIDCATENLDLTRALGVTEKTLAGCAPDASVRLPATLRADFWDSGTPPFWAHDWGRDHYGPWVSFRVPGTQVEQRMRWIPPGEFMMGSPDDENGRSYREGPLHRVTIAHGFWIFDTACRQELWQAVTSEKWMAGSPEAPMTSVSWDDARRFISQLNRALPGLALELPSEALWEYACRAGTTTPYHFGAHISRRQVRYGTADGPVPVGSLPPNAWGLHETHGNVWEWCADSGHHDYNGAPNDGSVWRGNRNLCVFRGGSWLGHVRLARSASRYWGDPGDAHDDLGFRCARGSVGSPAECEPREAGRGKQGSGATGGRGRPHAVCRPAADDRV
jgi:formylglycine-generating enzyme required for sulfatase activity